MKCTNALNRVLLSAALVLPLVVAPTAALAHAGLVASVPTADAGGEAAPSELRLSFSEAVELAFSDVVVRGAGGEEVATGELATDPEDGATLVVPLEAPLEPGGYLVEWTVVSGDGHKVSGSYGLTIAP